MNLLLFLNKYYILMRLCVHCINSDISIPLIIFASIHLEFIKAVASII